MTLLRTAAFLMMTAVISTPAMAVTQSVTIHNNTDTEIVDLYADEYGDRGEIELLGNDTLEPDESVTATIDGGPDDDCVGDLRAVFADGTSDEIEDANICDDDDYAFD